MIRIKKIVLLGLLVCTSQLFSQTTKELQDKVDSLEISDWDNLRYRNVRTSITSYFDSVGQSGSMAEDDALVNLDYAYMSVIYKETKKVANNCFRYSSIKKEVNKFYKTYKNNKDIINSRALFGIKRKSEVYKKKVKLLLSKEFEGTSYDDLYISIGKFMDSGDYIKYLKDCNKKKNYLTLDGAYNDIKEFENVLVDYYNFLNFYKQNKETWEKNGNVPYVWLNKFKDYEWYYDEIKKINTHCKNKKETND